MTQARIAEIAAAVPGAERIAREQLARVSWHRAPEFPQPGRTSWTALRTPIEAPELPVRRLAGLKLKGVGNANGKAAPTPPTGRLYERTISHVGIEDDGRIVLKFSAPAPEGGIYLDRARAEFENAARLLEHGCPAVVPIALYEYEDLRCEGDPRRPLGAVLCASPCAGSERADAAFRRAGDNPVAEVSALAERFGRTLRMFHSAGLYRFNGYPGNYQDLPGEGLVCLVDLDSSRPLAECSARRAPLEILRDLAGAMFYLAATMIQPRVCERFAPEGWREGGPFSALARGYFAELGDGLPTGLGAALLWHYERKHAAIREAMRQGGMTAVASVNWRLDRDWVVVRTMAEAADPYAASSLAELRPLKWNPDAYATAPGLNA